MVMLQFVSTMANLYLPRLNADIIDDGIAREDIGRIWTAGGEMLALSALQITATVFAVYFGGRIAAGLGRDLRAAVFHKASSFSSRELNGFGAPTLITRCTNDVQQIQQLTLMGANMLMTTPITVVGGVYMALREDAGLSWLVAVCVPVMTGSLGIIVVLLVSRFRAMQVRIDAINGILREQLMGMRVIRAFVREDHEASRFARANTEITSTATQVGRLSALMFPTVMLVFNISGALVLWFGAHRVASGDVQVGSLIAFLTYLTQILFSVMMATFVMSMVPRAYASAERIGAVLGTQSTVVPPVDGVTEMDERSALDFEDASFQYPHAGEPVVRNATFSVRAGQRFAIVGSTGAGKTTIVNLIPRLMDVTSGVVRVGGIDVRQLDPDALARRVAIVPQNAYLFSGTVASNLRYGNPTATDEELWAALRIAQADDFVRAMPDGLQASISQGGANVSGGQRQRLAIARAIVRQPDIYVFDDSFSALDMTTDARLRAALDSAIPGKAMVVVAQRVSTIRNADHIIVLEGGSIVGAGKHDELLMSCETYKEIVESQLTADGAA